MTMRALFVFFAFLISLLNVQAVAQEFLDPMVAFKPTARALDGQTVEIRYEIAKGYYLYRDKFRVHPVDENITLGELQIPRGKEKNDENFGLVEVFYKEVAFRVPVDRISSGSLALRLDVISQGCADAGVCYPPQTQTVDVVLPDPASTPAVAPMAQNAPAGEGDES
ncbi:MAG: protein-disulfide reductase DsbD N-terminal domain-containing protein, partial [Azonexus sp.]|nr:protein-disulfide reductase DsbD N-terminal domain-containing protein [Azonexus sp.]